VGWGLGSFTIKEDAESEGIPLLRILTDRGTEYCGKPDHHAFQLYLGIEDIDHSKTKANHPQTNGICERFHRTMQDECYTILFRKKRYSTLSDLQTDVDEWLRKYNHDRPHSGRFCFGKTPYQTFLDSKHIAFQKSPALLLQPAKEVHNYSLSPETSYSSDPSYS